MVWRLSTSRALEGKAGMGSLNFRYAGNCLRDYASRRQSGEPRCVDRKISRHFNVPIVRMTGERSPSLMEEFGKDTGFLG
jgi:hypothetical protein